MRSTHCSFGERLEHRFALVVLTFYKKLCIKTILTTIINYYYYYVCLHSKGTDLITFSAAVTRKIGIVKAIEDPADLYNLYIYLTLLI